MKTRIAAVILATLGGTGAMLLPAAAFAGNVGYYGACWGGDKAAPIALAGHTPVAVPNLSPASLATLNALVIERCDYNGTPQLSAFVTPDVVSAVASGMKLIVNDWDPGASTAAALPGAPSVNFVFSTSSDINIAAGSPIATGPAGPLTDSSLDGGNSSSHGYTTTNLGASNRLLTGTDSANTVAFAYPYGNGLVIYNAIPMDAYLTGANLQSNPAGPGMRAYLTNLIAAALNGSIAPSAIVQSPSTTCASSGYTGTKLLWCQNICEKGYTGLTLNAWIYRWTNKYRDLPYCMQETTPPPQPQG